MIHFFESFELFLTQSYLGEWWAPKNIFQLSSSLLQWWLYWAAVTLSLVSCFPKSLVQMTPSSSIVLQINSLFTIQIFVKCNEFKISVKGSEYAAPIQRKNVYGEPANPGFVPLPTFNPYAMMYQQPQQMLYNGWSYFYGHPGRSNSEGVPSTRQLDDEEGKGFSGKQTVQQLQIAAGTTTTTTPKTTTTTKPTTTTTISTPRLIQCGRGPIKFPDHDHHHRKSISQRISLSAAANPDVVVTAKKNAWPFMVSLLISFLSRCLLSTH